MTPDMERTDGSETREGLRPAERPRPRPGRAFGGVWRLTYPGFLAAGGIFARLGAIAALGLLSTQVVRPGDPASFASWIVSFHLCLLVPALSFLSGAGALRDEMMGATVDYVHTRPAGRPFLAASKFVAHYACFQAPLFLALVVIIAVGIVREIPGAASMFPALFAAQLLASATFMALGFLFASVTSRYLVLGILYAATIEAGLGSTPTQLNKLSLLRHLRTFLDWEGESLPSIALAPASPSLSVLVLLLATAAFLAAAAWIFGVREYLGGGPKEA